MKYNTSLIGPQIRCELRCKMKTKVHKRVKLVSVIHFSTIRIFLTVSMIAYSKGSNIPRTQITNGVGNKKLMHRHLME